MVRYLTAQEKWETYPLWEDTFGKEAIKGDFYYNTIISQNQVLGIKMDGEWVSMLHMNPYSLEFRGKTWEIPYIVGLATKPEYRRRGYMRQLLTQAIMDGEKKGIPFAFIMPVKADFYSSMGFAKIYDRYFWKGELTSPDAQWVETDDSWNERLAELSNRYMREYFEAYIVRDASYFQERREAVKGRDGSIMALVRKEEPIGWACGYPEKGIWEEVRCTRYNLVETLDMLYQTSIMGRILNLESFLGETIAQGDFCIHMKVVDPMIEKNNRIYRWQVSMEKARVEPVEEEPELTITIDGLASWLFGYKSLKQLKSEGLVAYEDKCYEKLKRVIPVRGICINELL